jgi:hypothetical protein
MILNQMSRKAALRNRLRTSTAGTVLTIALAIYVVCAANATADQGTVALPTVHVVTKEISFHHKRALLVESIAVGNLEGVTLSVSCDRCRRYSTKIHEARPTPTTKSFSGVSWIIIVGRDIQIAVSKSGQTGRFLLLGAGLHNTLAFKASGCLTAKPVRRVSCPRTAPAAPVVGSTVPGGNPAEKSGSETTAPVETKKKTEESAVKKKAEEEAAANKKAEQEVAAKEKAEEEAAKHKAEEEAAKHKAEEEAAKHKAEEEAANRTYSETPGGEVHTWTDYADAGGSEGPTIPSNETVQIKCRIEGFRVSDGNTWWYLIASGPWNNQYYGSADAFYNNGETSGSLKGTPFVDANVPVC